MNKSGSKRTRYIDIPIPGGAPYRIPAMRQIKHKERNLIPFVFSFGYKKRVYQLLDDKTDREIFFTRATRWLTRSRRGKLKFPLWFPEEIRALSRVSRSEFLTSVKKLPRKSVCHVVSPQDKEIILDKCPGHFYLSDQNYLIHEKNKYEAKMLQRSFWPRLGSRPAWPSSPTLAEYQEMIEKGKETLPFQKCEKVNDSLTPLIVKQSPIIASMIVSRQIVGIRSSERVPREFLPYFRYRWNFLILVTRWKIPIGLVRFLLSRWKTNPHCLWLKRKVYLRDYIRSSPGKQFRIA